MRAAIALRMLDFRLHGPVAPNGAKERLGEMTKLADFDFYLALGFPEKRPHGFHRSPADRQLGGKPDRLLLGDRFLLLHQIGDRGEADDRA
ncbi:MULTISPECIES: hypothetical protein [unclassified Rhizobium]|jgi:hypothetical protein|uniref:hypothetical protein n=1 Tax=unclassified Rhizobium TaxID=2613769 RepID=UPI001FF03C7C|nr:MULTISPECIES: hypothetical protein [unclassified Rhizobium]